MKIYTLQQIKQGTGFMPTARFVSADVLMSPAQLATILAALRSLQADLEQDMVSPAIQDIATDGGELTSLDSDGIDELAEWLNTSGPVDRSV